MGTHNGKRYVTLLNPGGRNEMARHHRRHHRNARRARRNPPEGGYGMNVVHLLAGSVVAFGAAALATYGVGKLGSSLGEGTQDLIVGLGGLVIGGAVALLGTPGKVRVTVGRGIAAGCVTVAGVRYAAYAMAGSAVQSAIDSARTAAGALPAGAVISSNAYMGQGAGAPISSNAYMGYGVGAA